MWWEAWLHTQQHTDPIPNGVDVPVFFSYTASIDGINKNWGHIGVRLKDGTFWSDGTIYPTISAYTANHSPRYVGWGESVNDVRVITNSTSGAGSTPSAGGKIMDTDAKVAAQYNTLRGNTGTPAERKAWIGKSYESFNATAVPEINARQANLANLQKQVASQNVSIAALNTKVTALTNQVNTLTAQVKSLTATIAVKDKEIATLKSQVATGSSEDTQLLNSLGEILRKIIARVGLK